MEELEHLIKEYQARFKDSINYIEQHKILLTYSSATLEGSTLSLIDTEFLVKEGRTPLGKPLEHSLMAKDHFHALSFVLDEAQKKTPITEKFIKTIGGMVREHTGSLRETMLGTFDERKGDYRLLPVHANVLQADGSIKSISYPDLKKVPALMKWFCEFMASKLNAVSRAEEVYNLSYDAHYHLRRIHPFSDGNSRTSRLLMNYVQAYHGYPVTPVNAQHRAGYIKSFYESSKTDSSPMRAFLLNETKQFLSDMTGRNG